MKTIKMICCLITLCLMCSCAPMKKFNRFVSRELSPAQDAGLHVWIGAASFVGCYELVPDSWGLSETQKNLLCSSGVLTGLGIEELTNKHPDINDWLNYGGGVMFGYSGEYLYQWCVKKGLL